MTTRRLSALVTAAERDIEAARRLLPAMPDQAIGPCDRSVQIPWLVWRPLLASWAESFAALRLCGFA